MTARQLALGTALLGATATSGCVVVKQEHARQLDGIGDVVQITAKVCMINESPVTGTDCMSTLVDPGDYQGLLSLRVPADLELPGSIPTGIDGVTLSPSASLTSELERTAAAGEGMKWAGYISPVQTLVSTGPGAPGPLAAIAADVVLPPRAAGAVREGLLRYQVVGGYRQISAETTPDPTDPVVCSDTPGAGLNGTICIDVAEPDTLTAFHELELADVALAAPPAPVQVERGRTAALTFGATVSGAPSGVEITASTAAPGASATAAVASLVTSGDVPVSVVVPAAAAPGDYPVTLTATAGAETRTATGTLRVVAPVTTPPPPPPPPADTSAPALVAKAVKGQTPRRVARKGLKLRLTLSEPATVAGGLARGKTVEATLPEGTSTLRLKLKQKARRAVRRARKAKLALALTATDAAGNVGTLERSVTVKRPRR